MKNKVKFLIAIGAFFLFSSVSSLSAKLRDKKVLYDTGKEMKNEFLSMRNTISKQRLTLAEQSIVLKEVLKNDN